MTAHQYRDGDRLQGVRFRFDGGSQNDVVSQLQIRPGADRSVVVEAPVMAGPIVVHDLWNEPDVRYGYAKCHNCGASSKGYRIDRKSPAMQAWAHGHRCDVVRVQGGYRTWVIDR